MTDPVSFLTALTQALSTMSLYGDDHPATTRALGTALERLHELQEPDPKLRFTFLAGDVVFGSEVVQELEGWEWSSRMVKAGVERIEILGPVELDHFGRFLSHLAIRLGIRPGSSGDIWQMGESSIRYGQVTLSQGQGQSEILRLEPAMPVATVTYTLREERDTMDWVHKEIQNGAKIPMVEADAVVRSLSIAMHAERAMVLPLLQLKEFDQYTTTHSMNVAVLAMALAESLELGSAQVRAVGVAGLLHDLGKVRVAKEVLLKPGKLTEAERAEIQRHPVEGARILLAGDQPLDLAAVVAYEHHLMLDGSGYPCRHSPRDTHYGSRLVHVCDVYDALRTKRPYRDAWESEKALKYIEERSGLEFDPALASTFAGMIRRWDHRVMGIPPASGDLHDPLVAGSVVGVPQVQ
jgi:putative nucleotidyltransferase with HDIG domain